MATRVEKILGLLQPGDVLNCDSKPRWWEVWLRVVYAQIRNYQKRKWKGRSPLSQGWRDVHSMLYLGGGVVLSVTVPTAVICNLDQEIRDNTQYRIYRYQGKDWRFGTEELGVIRETARSLEGTGYDYGQLVDILLKQLFPEFTKEKMSIFDLGRKKKVCSVGVHVCLLAGWYRFGKGIRPRPLGKQFAEVTCPADFACDGTFEVVAEDL